MKERVLLKDKEIIVNKKVNKLYGFTGKASKERVLDDSAPFLLGKFYSHCDNIIGMIDEWDNNGYFKEGGELK